MTVEYQIGVDVLGFPMYMRHEIKTGSTKPSFTKPKPKKWTKCLQSIIKQH
jgi:hypothetical protein